MDVVPADYPVVRWRTSTGPLPGGPLNNRQVQAVVVLGSGRVPVFPAFEGELVEVMASRQPYCLGIGGKHPCCIGRLNRSQQNKFAG
jgi:hypothetical protein